jgi:hypothetical protein
MRAASTLVVPVACYDWPLIPWLVRSWAPVVDDALLVYSMRAELYTRPRRPGDPTPDETLERLVAAADELNAEPAISRRGRPLEVRTLPYALPPRELGGEVDPFRGWEVAVRNAASWLTTPGGLVLAPDADEGLTAESVEPMLDWLDEQAQWAGDRVPVSIRATYEREVLRVDGDRALVLDEPAHRVPCIGANRPGAWYYSRVTAGEQVTCPARLLHWRLRPELVAEYRDFHLGAGHEEWRRGLPVGPAGSTLDLPARWDSDARHWRRAVVVPVAELGALPTGAARGWS